MVTPVFRPVPLRVAFFGHRQRPCPLRRLEPTQAACGPNRVL